MDRYAKPRRNGPVHRVLVDRGVAFKHEPCNLDDAAYFRLEDERPEGRGCLHCRPDEPHPPAEDEAAQATEEKVPALGKNDVPSSLLLIPKRLAALAMAIIAAVVLMTGTASGVVLSPDFEAVAETSGVEGTVSPAPSCNPATLEGCGDLVLIIETLIDQQLLHHLEIDHPPDVSPTPSSSPPSSFPIDFVTPRPTDQAGPAPTRRPDPTARPTPRPTPRPTARPTPGPEPTPCFRPGKSKGGKDPCDWPVDG